MKEYSKKIMTWNVGSISFLKYFKAYEHEYFQPELNSNFISSLIEKENPDLIVLQEIYNEEDILRIDVLKAYPHRLFIENQHHEHAIFIASKYPFESKQEGRFKIIQQDGTSLVPLHLHSFSAQKRYQDMTSISQLFKRLNRLIVLGDTNMWSKKNFFLFSCDYYSYKSICFDMKDVSRNIRATSITGFNLDKVFTSRDIQIDMIKTLKERGKYMDHYPIIFSISDI